MAISSTITPGAARTSEDLRARLEELEETLRAIHQGEVDALLVSTSEGDRVFTLQGADHPYRVMVETINEGAATVSTRGEILYANRRFAEMLAVPLEQLIGSTMEDIIESRECPTLDELLERARTVPQKEECLLRVLNGSLPVLLSMSPLKGLDVQAICIIATDLTEHRKREAQLADTNERLRSEIAERHRVEKAFRQLTGRVLNLQDEERRRIARDLHESTSQSLNRLVLNLAYVQKEAQFEGTSAVAKMLAESMEVAQQVSKEIRDLSHLLYPPALDHMGLIPAMQAHAARTSEVTEIEITHDLPTEMPRLPRETAIALFRVVQESLENVRRHSGSKTAEIRLARHHGAVLLEVKDQGAGMPPDLLAEPAASVAGLGVGVAGMRERLRQLGGRLEIKSGEGGTTVRATVPVTEKEGLKTSRPAGAPLRILIADDAEVVRRSVRAVFEVEPDLAVVGEAANGHEAIERTVELQPDIVVLDLTMPRMGGLEASRQIRVVVPSARIVVLSQDDSPETVREARNAGALGYILKSDAARELMAGVRVVSEGKTFLSATVAGLVPPDSL